MWNVSLICLTFSMLSFSHWSRRVTNLGKEGESREWLYEENLIKSIDPLLRKTQIFIPTIKLIMNP